MLLADNILFYVSKVLTLASSAKTLFVSAYNLPSNSKTAALSTPLSSFNFAQLNSQLCSASDT